ncbi:aspartate--tRNA ligase [Candidatus Falkowbacteria bacterium]|nr:aspartate--tRNA ligase [Candidatus Falkowbacteria bacterium]
MTRTLIKDTVNKIGEEVLLKGWIHVRRDMGKIIFIDLRDATGLIQVVFASKDKDFMALADKLRSEFVVAITGKVNKRPEKMVNPKLLTGMVEMEAKKLEILNESKTLPFEIDKDTAPVNEELRMKYRYLDLRSERMKKNILLRSQMLNEIKNFLHERGFAEIETPYITKGTPEGAREYMVPSRLHPGKFYVLPQSPQQFKQLLMVAGFEKYFQIARCFRDEDQRGDRQPEFTQIDMEMSFVDQEDVMKLTEEMMIHLAKVVAPEKKIQKKPFLVLTYDEAIKKYKTDKPDLRKDKNDKNELAFCWVIDFPLFEWSETEKKLVSSHHPFTMPHKEDIEMLDEHPLDVRAYAYDLVLNGYEVGGGSIRIHDRNLQSKIFRLLGVGKDDAEARFGHMFEAFTYGAPPHGGIAPGLDRLAMIFAGEPNIREVIAFPKTSDARDLMMGAPSELPEEQLKEAHIKVLEK